jgi:hypothetical protein
MITLKVTVGLRAINDLLLFVLCVCVCDGEFSDAKAV